jgi:hypothetical protein
MSTNILRYENGKRTVEAKGLHLYLEVVLPLTVSSFVAWWVIYRYFREAEFQDSRRKYGAHGQHTS